MTRTASIAAIAIFSALAPATASADWGDSEWANTGATGEEFAFGANGWSWADYTDANIPEFEMPEDTCFYDFSAVDEYWERAEFYRDSAVNLAESLCMAEYMEPVLRGYYTNQPAPKPTEICFGEEVPTIEYVDPTGFVDMYCKDSLRSNQGFVSTTGVVTPTHTVDPMTRNQLNNLLYRVGNDVVNPSPYQRPFGGLEPHPSHHPDFFKLNHP